MSVGNLRLLLVKNVPYLLSQISAFLAGASPLVKVICSLSFVLYWLSYSEDAVDVLSVTPGYIIPPNFWLWTVFTYCFLEIHLWEVFADILAVGLCCKLIEPLWGRREMIIFFSVVNLGVLLLTTAFYLFLYVCTFNTDLLFHVHIHGLAGYMAGLSVAVKQIMPDHCLIKTPIGKITNRNVPLLICICSIILYIVGLLEGVTPAMFTSGLLVSWTYLRFYQSHTNRTRGDLADNFSFASFFPNVLQPPVAVLGNSVYAALVRVGVCRKTIRKFDMSSAPTGVTVTLPGIDPQDIERRKQIALKALNERLSKAGGDPMKMPLLPPLSTSTSSHPAAPASSSSSVGPPPTGAIGGPHTFIPIPNYTDDSPSSPPASTPSIPVHIHHEDT